MFLFYKIPLRPITKKNSMQLVKVKGKLIPIPSKQYKQYEHDAGFFIRAMAEPISTPIRMQCIYYFHPNKDGSIPKSAPDLANLIEATCDVLVHYGVIKDDNCTIVASHDGSKVVYDADQAERTEVEITNL